MFWYIAMGRLRLTLSFGSPKNWLHSGSHDAAQNIVHVLAV